MNYPARLLILSLVLCSSAFAVSGPYTIVDNGSNTKEVDNRITLIQGLDGSGNRINISGGGDASAANQTSVQANAGADATKVTAVQGVTGGKAIPVSLAVAVSTKPDVSTIWSYAAAVGGITNTTTAVTIKAAVASQVNYINAVQVSADALGAATEVVIRAGASGTVLWRMKISTAGLSPISIPLPSPLPSGTNTLLEVATLTATVTGGVYINAQGATY